MGTDPKQVPSIKNGGSQMSNVKRFLRCFCVGEKDLRRDRHEGAKTSHLAPP